MCVRNTTFFFFCFVWFLNQQVWLDRERCLLMVSWHPNLGTYWLDTTDHLGIDVVYLSGKTIAR